jgi:hypothetical protein
VNSLKQILNKINWLKIAELVLVTVLVFAPLLTVHAQTSGLSRNFNCDTNLGLKCGETSVNGLIKTVINWMLGIAFAIAVVFLIIGGFMYITSAGNEESAEKGKGTVLNALIGIVIIILSYVIVNVVANLVTNNNVGAG